LPKRWNVIARLMTRLPGVIVAIVCGLPLAWAAWVVAAEPRTIVAGLWDARLLGLFARTSFYAVAASLLATAIALPVGLALGRGRGGVVARALWLVVPLPLLLPTMVLGYGWTEALRIVDVHPRPQSAGDVLRCVWVLATWCWPVPAALVALALRRVDASLLEQAALDGATARLVARRTAGPAAIGALACVALCLQEFSIFEPTGISVMATEVRMIFETGALSSSANPIAALVGGVGAAAPADLPGRAALALAAGAPVLLLTAMIAAAVLLLARRGGADEAIELGDAVWSLPSPSGGKGFASCAPSSRFWPVLARRHAVSCGVRGAVALAWLVVLLTVAVPLLAMALSLGRPFDPLRVLNELRPQVTSSLALSASTAAVVGVIALLAVVAPPRVTLPLAVAGYLLGGQFTAIAILRLCDSPWATAYVLDTNVAAVWAYASRFAWVGLAAGGLLHGGAWRRYREMAAVDGATAWQAAWRAITPMAWPALLAAAVLTMALTLTEVPATALLTPPSLVPMLLTWVHMQRYGPMLEASLLLAGVVLVLGWTAAGLAVLMRRRVRR
jgi:ABC-type Fe3+ transport system permease subunit